MPMLRVENCPMLVKHHGCLKMVVPSQDGNYHQMAKQFQENSKMKVFPNNIAVYNELFSWGRIIKS